jgi:23S rRNA (cytosine1962-C5)-methyltransferase
MNVLIGLGWLKNGNKFEKECKIGRDAILLDVIIQPLTPTYWTDYELIDSGDFQKFERFGSVTLVRPEPQAIWKPTLSEQEWKKASVSFVGRSPSTGDWRKPASIPDRWNIRYKSPNLDMQLRLAFTSFKHVGVFPEQAVNWEYIAERIRSLKAPNPRFLNLFAYTGAASIAARAAGATVIELTVIRWMVDDAVKFVQKEVRRGNTYHGIILDPPAYGHGPKGEKWKLEDSVYDLMSDVVKLLDPKEHFIVLNTYSLGFSAVVAGNLLRQTLGARAEIETGELLLTPRIGVPLPLGVFARAQKSDS